MRVCYLVQLDELRQGSRHLDGDLHDVLLLRHVDVTTLLEEKEQEKMTSSS